MSKALLICNGQQPEAAFLRRLADEADFVLAADGGANVAAACGVTPNLIIGDLDSLSPLTRTQFNNVPQLFVDNQNNTDFEKALDYLLEKNFSRCTVVSADGKRPDFTTGNLLSAFRYAGKLRLSFVSEEWTVYPLTTSAELAARPGARVSLLPLGPVRKLTLSGLQFPLTNADWELGDTGLSNVAESARVTVSFSSGSLLAYVEN